MRVARTSIVGRKDVHQDTARLLPYASPVEMTPSSEESTPQPLNRGGLPPNAWAFATVIQARFRGARVRRAVHRWLGRAVGVPDLARAKAHARSLLPHDQDGRLLPLSCPIECFTVFGAGVYAYMRWTVLMKRVYFVAFLFSIANMVNNIFGGELTEGTWLSVPTIGNAKQLNAAYGASEVLVLGTFMWGMFAAVKIVRKEEALLQPLHTPGEQTVMLRGLPPHATRQSLVHCMSRYGEVSHAVLAAPIRPTLLRMPERARLLQQVLTARIELFLRGQTHPHSKRYPASAKLSTPASMKSAKTDTPGTGMKTVARAEAAATAAAAAAATGRQAPKALKGHEQRRAALVARVEAATKNLHAHDETSAEMLRQVRGGTGGGVAAIGERRTALVPTPCGTLRVGESGRGGVAFVTFTEPNAAARAITAIKDAHVHGMIRNELAPLFDRPVEDVEADGADVGGAARGTRARIEPAGGDGNGALRISARRAPEPSDVTWEDLHVGYMEKLWRQFFSTLAMLAIACVGTVIIAGVMYVNGTQVYTSLINLPGGFEGFVLSSGLQLGMALPIILGNVILFFSVPQVRHLPIPPHTSPHLPTPPHTSPHLPTSLLA